MRLTPDKAIRWSAVAAVAVVAGAAGWVSYQHALEVVRLAGAAGSQAYVYPVFVDGLVYMSSMVLLSAARRKLAAPALAWWSLAAGIAATLAANVYSMAAHGVLGMLVGALPAGALVLSYELLMWLIRQGAARGEGAPVPAPANGHDPLVTQFRPYLEAGKVPGVRAIKKELNCGQPRAQEVREKLQKVLAAH